MPFKADHTYLLGVLTLQVGRHWLTQSLKLDVVIESRSMLSNNLTRLVSIEYIPAILQRLSAAGTQSVYVIKK